MCLEPKYGQSNLQLLDVYYANFGFVAIDMYVYDLITRILIIKNVCCRKYYYNITKLIAFQKSMCISFCHRYSSFKLPIEIL